MTKKQKTTQWGGVREGSGRPAELKGAATKSIVFDARSIAAVNRYLKKRKGVSFSAAVRELLSK